MGRSESRVKPLVKIGRNIIGGGETDPLHLLASADAAGRSRCEKTHFPSALSRFRRREFRRKLSPRRYVSGALALINWEERVEPFGNRRSDSLAFRDRRGAGKHAA
jgi:hypothetical protein